MRGCKNNEKKETVDDDKKQDGTQDGDKEKSRKTLLVLI